MFWFASFAKRIGSPGTTEAKLRQGLSFNGDTLESWDLRRCNLTALPEEFGAVRTTGDLRLDYNNRLATLPDSFGNLVVGGHLYLNHNQLATLPDSFGNLVVGGGLGLCGNRIATLPRNFANVTVGEDLVLKWCGADMGAALREAATLEFRNVKGNVRK